MSRWELIDTATVPNGSELRFYRRDNDFSIRVPKLGELMNSRAHGSEDALAEITCEAIAERQTPRLLIGGLGMGFTLAAALSRLPAHAEVVVAELVPQVVTWNQGPLGEHAGRPLDDARVRVEITDVAKLVRACTAGFDGIAMDVDNGPEGLTRRANDWLYSLDGLWASYQALRPAGVLTVWSASPDRPFTERLRKAGFEVAEKRVRAHGKKGSRHLIWTARRPD